MRFDSYHPLINLIYFAAAISCSIAFNHPLFVLLSFVCALICAFSLRGSRALLVLLALLPLMALYTWWYSFYNHFGVTALGENFAGNSITAEALFYGASLSLRAGAVALFISCLLAVFTADKVVYLFGRLSPKLSLFIAIPAAQRAAHLSLCPPHQRLSAGNRARARSGKSACAFCQRPAPVLGADHLDAGKFPRELSFHAQPWLFAKGADGVFALPF